MLYKYSIFLINSINILQYMTFSAFYSISMIPRMFPFCTLRLGYLLNMDWYFQLPVVSIKWYLKVSEPKWVNPILNIIGVNSLRLGGLQIYIYKIYIIKFPLIAYLNSFNLFWVIKTNVILNHHKTNIFS